MVVRIPLSSGWRLGWLKEGETKAAEPNFDDSSWIEVKVPSEVHLELLRHGLIEDPFFHDNLEKCLWIQKVSWWYRRWLEGLDEYEYRQATILFHGLDTNVSVWINGKLIASHKNMFRPLELDITKELRRRKRSLLALEFLPLRKPLPTSHEELWRKLRPQIRKAQMSFGWDIAPRLLTIGIWRSVYLVLTQNARILDVYVKTKLERNGELALLDVLVEIESLIESKEAILEIQLSDHGKHILEESKQVHLKEGINKFRLALRIDSPRLWWPWDLGEPHLYTLVARLYVNGALEDSRELRIGLREVRLVTRDKNGSNRFTFIINGIPVYARGFNWTPPDAIFVRTDRAVYHKLLTMVKDMNGNMLRVWGGGVYEDDAFYDLCDELGIMIWQDFMFACGEYPEEGWFLEKVKLEAEKIVKRLRNHPCIVLWCGDNENEWGARAGFWGPRGRIISHRILAEVCARLDPSRPYWPSSPFGGDDPNSMKEGDRHSWEVWSWWRDYKAYLEDKGRFISEFGFQAPPDISTIEAFTPPEDRWPLSRVLEHHNKMNEGMERLYRFLAAHFKVPESLEEFVYLTQVNQGEALKTGIEHWRRRKFLTSGCLIWQLNDCWPVISWSLIDYYLRPKAAYYFVKRAFSPILVSLTKEDDSVSVYVINDTLDPLDGTLELIAQDFEGKVLYRERSKVHVKPNSSLRVLKRKLSELRINNPYRQYVASVLEIGSAKYQSVLLLAEPKHLQLPKPTFKVDIKPLDRGRSFEIVIISDKFAKAVKLSVNGVDAILSDNYFDLLPGVPKKVELRLKEKLSLEELKRRFSITSIHG